MAQMTRETAQAGEALLWQLYDQITAQVLLIRGPSPICFLAVLPKPCPSVAPERIARNWKAWDMLQR